MENVLSGNLFLDVPITSRPVDVLRILDAIRFKKGQGKDIQQLSHCFNYHHIGNGYFCILRADNAAVNIDRPDTASPKGREVRG